VIDFPDDYELLTSIQRLELEIPALKGGNGYRDTSEETIVYNCLSWALGITWTRYDPIPRCAGYYWFPGIPRKWDEPTLRTVFENHNFRVAQDYELEPGYEKVVFYIDETGIPRHFARQLPSGRWTSKIGDLNDIEHDTLDLIIVPQYGKPGLVMKRKIQEDE
jgi:hypothetical protein